MALKKPDAKSDMDRIRREVSVRRNLPWLVVDEDFAVERNRSFLDEAVALRRQWLNWLGAANGAGILTIITIIGNSKLHDYTALILTPSIIAFLFGIFASAFAVSAAAVEAEARSELFGRSITYRRINLEIEKAFNDHSSSPGALEWLSMLYFDRSKEWREVHGLHESYKLKRYIRNITAIASAGFFSIGICHPFIAEVFGLRVFNS